MQFPESWLREFCNPPLSTTELADLLTMAGMEVEELKPVAPSFSGIVVAEIVEAEQHPNADRLRVCRVDAGPHSKDGPLQIVCGAPNARAGIKVALANVGTIIPTNGMEIKKSKIRGVESQGMLCSARELGLGEDHAGIMELSLDSPIGESIVEVLGLNDPVIDLAITANRGDCMSIYGIARELAAKGLGMLKPRPQPALAITGKSSTEVRIDVPELCPAFIGRTIKNVKNGPSPEWLQQRLKSVGLRPISALVDITNFMTIAHGRPLHVYDVAKLKGHIHVREARTGEAFDALNDKHYALNDKHYTVQPGMCAIADDSGLIGLGGIVGGVSTGVTETTTDVFLECAYFMPAPLGKTGRALGVDSDARARFERGIDPDFMMLGADIATQMILELCGGEACEAVIAGTIPSHTREIRFDEAFINTLGGTALSKDRMTKHLKVLGFEVKGDVAVTPSWRSDLEQTADLAEEVLRLEGYDTIPAVSLPKPALSAARALNDAQLRISRCRRLLASRGLNETHTWGFMSEADAAQFVAQDDGLKLRNAISAELSVMRSTLLAHLVRGVAKNQARGNADVHLFEIGAVFGAEKKQYQETVSASVRVGQMSPLSWQGGKEADIYTAKADCEALLAECGLDASKVTFATANVPSYYHPGRSAAVMLGPKNLLGYVGELHPAVLNAYDVTGRLVACELFLERIPQPKPAKRRALKASDFQRVTRDFAFVVDAALPASELLKAVSNADKLLVREVALFDMYQGKNVEAGKKSLGLRITLQADDRTLTDAEIDVVAQAVIKAAQSLGGILR